MLAPTPGDGPRVPPIPTEGARTDQPKPEGENKDGGTDGTEEKTEAKE